MSKADICLTNFRPASAVRLGLDAEELCQKYPRLIVGWVTGFGPDQNRPGFDDLVQAESGFITMTGPAHGPPCRLPVALIDLMTAHQLKAGLLLALLERGRTGRGKVVEVSLWRSALAALANQATSVLMAGQEPKPCGTEHPNLFPYGTLLQCCDGPILVAVGTDRQFLNLCQTLGEPELAELYPTNSERNEHRELLRERLARLTQEKPGQPLLEELARRGVPAGRLQTVSQALESPEAHRLRLDAGEQVGLRSVAFGGFARAPLTPPPSLLPH